MSKAKQPPYKKVMAGAATAAKKTVRPPYKSPKPERTGGSRNTIHDRNEIERNRRLQLMHENKIDAGNLEWDSMSPVEFDSLIILYSYEHNVK